MKREILSRLILEHAKVTWEGKVGNYTQFVSYKMTFWLALPSWLLKVHNKTFHFKINFLISLKRPPKGGEGFEGKA